MADPNHDIKHYIHSVEFHLQESFGLNGPIVVKASDALKKPKMQNQRKDEIQITRNSRGPSKVKLTINFREELELEPQSISLTLVFDGLGVNHKEYYRVSKNFLR